MMIKKIPKGCSFETTHELIRFITQEDVNEVKELSKRLGIPYNTVYNWFMNLSNAPSHFNKMIAEYYNHH